MSNSPTNFYTSHNSNMDGIDPEVLDRLLCEYTF